MKTYFSIGEMSKINNISIQALRYYDQIDLFKPNYINPKNHYRYYHIKQFFYLDIIKYLKYINTPLAEIKSIINSGPETMYSFLDAQEAVIRAKVDKLQRSQQLINMRKSQLAAQLLLKKQELGKVYTRTIPERPILKVACARITPYDEPDLYMHELAAFLEKAGSLVDNHYGCIYPLKPYSSSAAIHYEAVYTSVVTQPLIPLSSKISSGLIPAGKYLCIAFEWSSEHYYRYYSKLLTAANKRKLPPNALVYEVSLPNNYNSAQKENFITELQILINN
ncbi:MerR family transcriptional regulator [Liquorilactobacillus satsumensis]|uniref:HTH merR-type domain-containing protein n=1 Tax=Liquorilactobacillus satsumensis DSM 16230 = JCM 12392 TaxID=1423801 RepID=A0A0R1V2P4_9LACO|nr:MerR family transcriptional regulator [Liquorilactobacillus satsumensis]KRL96997.1 hypothetical protein FD50_GL001942 [Liquorilactobacillus satsumensis DSM 16230 = JCM 12392]